MSAVCVLFTSLCSNPKPARRYVACYGSGGVHPRLRAHSASPGRATAVAVTRALFRVSPPSLADENAPLLFLELIVANHTCSSWSQTWAFRDRTQHIRLADSKKMLRAAAAAAPRMRVRGLYLHERPSCDLYARRHDATCHRTYPFCCSGFLSHESGCSEYTVSAILQQSTRKMSA